MHSNSPIYQPAPVESRRLLDDAALRARIDLSALCTLLLSRLALVSTLRRSEHPSMISFPSFLPRKGTAALAEPKQSRKESKFSSGLDFSDGRPSSFGVPLSPHHDTLVTASNPSTSSSPVRQNKSEQPRLQGLMRSETTDHMGVDGEESRSGWKKLRVWMTNEGELQSKHGAGALAVGSEGGELTLSP